MFDENLVKSGGRILGRWLRAEINLQGTALIWLQKVLARNRLAT
jgi:hypothetical protein